MMDVRVPGGVGPGSALQIRAPDGAVFSVTVPPGMYPGGTFRVRVPGRVPAAAGPPASPVYLNRGPKWEASHVPITFDDTHLPKVGVLDKILNSQLVLLVFGLLSTRGVAMAMILAGSVWVEPFVQAIKPPGAENRPQFYYNAAPDATAQTATLTEWYKHKPEGDIWMTATLLGVTSARICTNVSSEEQWSKSVASRPIRDILDYDGQWPSFSKCSGAEIRAGASINQGQPPSGDNYLYAARTPAELFGTGNRNNASSTVNTTFLWEYVITPSKKSCTGGCPDLKKNPDPTALPKVNATDKRWRCQEKFHNPNHKCSDASFGTNFVWAADPGDPNYKTSCAFTFTRIQLENQAPCTGSLVLSVRSTELIVRYILATGLYAKVFVIFVSFCQACRARRTPDDPTSNLGLRTQLNTPCATCMVYVCCCDTSTWNKNRVAKNVHDAKWAPEEQGCLATCNLIVSVWLLIGLLLSTVGVEISPVEAVKWTGVGAELLSILINVKNNAPLRFKAQYPAHCCGLFAIPWCKYVEHEDTPAEGDATRASGATDTINPSFGNAEALELSTAGAGRGGGEEAATWLKSRGLDKYAGIFGDLGIKTDGDLALVEEMDLREMGMSDAEIRQFNGGSTQPPTPRVPPLPGSTPTPPPPVPAPAPVPAPPEMTPEAKIVLSFLQKVGLGRYFRQLSDLGMQSLEDISLFEVGDLEEIGLTRVEARRLLKAVPSADSWPNQVSNAPPPPPVTKRYSRHETAEGEEYFVPESFEGDTVWYLPPGAVAV